MFLDSFTFTTGIFLVSDFVLCSKHGLFMEILFYPSLFTGS